MKARDRSSSLPTEATGGREELWCAWHRRMAFVEGVDIGPQGSGLVAAAGGNQRLGGEPSDSIAGQMPSPLSG